MRVGLTGASGYTGGHIMKALLSRGDSVKVLVREGSITHALQASGAEIVRGGLGDADAARRLANGCDALMHVAAAMKVPRQIVIESPAWGPTLAPYRRPFVLVENPAIHGRNLDYYRYDGAGIKGTPNELRRAMNTVTPEAVFEQIEVALSAQKHGH